MTENEHPENLSHPMPLDSDNIKRLLDAYGQMDTQLSSAFMSSMEVLLSGLIHKETQLEKNVDAIGEAMDLTDLVEVTKPTTGLVIGSYALLCAAQKLDNLGPPIIQVDLKTYRQMTLLSTIFYGDEKRLDLVAKTTLSHDDPEITLQAFAWGSEGYICMSIRKEELDSQASSMAYCAIVANMMLDATKLSESSDHPTLTHKL